LLADDNAAKFVGLLVLICAAVAVWVVFAKADFYS
jgi:hypothetical protein